MKAVESVEIKKFRGIKHGKIEDFKGINVFVGRNNSGKSSVLEALYLASNSCAEDLLGENSLKYVATRRGWFGVESALNLFFDKTDECTISLEFADEGKHVLRLKREAPRIEHLEVLKMRGINVSNVIAISTSAEAAGVTRSKYIHYIDEEGRHLSIVLEERKLVESLFLDWNRVYRYGSPKEGFSVLMERGGAEAKKVVVDVVKERYGEISDIAPLKIGDKWILHVIYEDQSRPFYLMGDGFKYALMYLMMLSIASEAMLFLEEPELHTHIGLLELVADALVRCYRDRRSQIFLSTHSLELIDMLLSAAKEKEVVEEVNIYRLYRREGVLGAKLYMGEEASELRTELEYDLRG